MLTLVRRDLGKRESSENHGWVTYEQVEYFKNQQDPGRKDGVGEASLAL